VDVAVDLIAQRAGSAQAAAGVALLRRSLDLQVAQSAQLLEVLPQPQPQRPSLESHLGGSIDLYG
jgi:hypothetical protein